jgi:hypothetical protein
VKKVIEERRRWSRDRNGVKFAEIGVEVVVVKEQMVRVCTLGGRPSGPASNLLMLMSKLCFEAILAAAGGTSSFFTGLPCRGVEIGGGVVGTG